MKGIGDGRQQFSKTEKYLDADEMSSTNEIIELTSKISGSWPGLCSCQPLLTLTKALILSSAQADFLPGESMGLEFMATEDHSSRNDTDLSQ